MNKISKALKNPNKALGFVLSKILTNKAIKEAEKHKKASLWYKESNLYTFKFGGFAGNTSNRAEFSARNYYEITQINQILRENELNPARSLEIGAGYGRLSSWISDFSNNHHSLEPNKDAAKIGEKLYPEITWYTDTIQNSELNQSYDLIVTWTVLQHIPPSEISKVVTKIQKYGKENGYLLICEETEEDRKTQHTWPRSVKEYKNLFNKYKLIDKEKRNLEHNKDGGTVMLLKKVNNS